MITFIFIIIWCWPNYSKPKLTNIIIESGEPIQTEYEQCTFNKGTPIIELEYGGYNTEPSQSYYYSYINDDTAFKFNQELSYDNNDAEMV